MSKSARLAPMIAFLLIWFLTISNIQGTKPSAMAQDGLAKAESKAAPDSKKPRKKRKKRAKKASQYYSLPMFLPTLTSARELQTFDSKPIRSLVPRFTPRVERTPGVHVTPVATKLAGSPFFSGQNSTPIVISSSNFGSEPIPAEPYSSDIEVSNLVGQVTSVSVTINGLNHSSPPDLDMLLVSPDGRAFHFWSDVGGTDITDGRFRKGGTGAAGAAAGGVTVTVADTGNLLLPTDGPLVDGTTYRPFNDNTDGDIFPLPAIGPPYAEPLFAGGATFQSVYGGMPAEFANGTWQLFVTDDRDGNGGVIEGGWTLNISTRIPFTSAGQLIISEFRTNGPLGPTDEFIELYNTTADRLTVQSSDASEGVGVFASDGILRCVVPNGTVIPKNGHYLCVNGSLETSEAIRSSIGNAIPDATFFTDIPDNAGIAVFTSSSTDPSIQILANRIDAVGSTLEENALFKEGNGYPALTTPGPDHSFFRSLKTTGVPKDTGDNASDFVFVDTDITPTSSGQRLGAPSPEGLGDPRSANEKFVVRPVAPCLATTATPNRVRSFDPATNASLGTMSVRKAITNLSVDEITRVRFKIIEITTAPVPVGTADLRFLTSVTASEIEPCSGELVEIRGIILQQPPEQPKGGGLNSNGEMEFPLRTPIFPGETVFVNFLFGVQQTGLFRFIVNIEALP